MRIVETSSFLPLEVANQYDSVYDGTCVHVHRRTCRIVCDAVSAPRSRDGQGVEDDYRPSGATQRRLQGHRELGAVA